MLRGCLCTEDTPTVNAGDVGEDGGFVCVKKLDKDDQSCYEVVCIPRHVPKLVDKHF